MPYYPKSQIVTSLYTNGGEYILSTTGEEYIGYYYEISIGKKYTGKSPNKRPNTLLHPLPDSSEQSHIGSNTNPLKVDTEVGYPNKSPQEELFMPQFNTPLPTLEDYKKEKFTRYFCKKNNELKYLEVDQTTYNKLTSKDPSILWSLYTPFSLQWKITTNSEHNLFFNRSSVLKLENSGDYRGFSSYIKSYSQYTLTQEELDQRLNTGGY